MLKYQSAIPKISKLVVARHPLLSSSAHYAAAAPISAEAVIDESWATARPYKDVPGPSLFDVVKLFRPGGSFKDKHFSDIQEELKNRYGNLVKMPGFLGKKDVLFVYEPEDFEKIFRTEGQYPIRRGFDSVTYYRTEIRKDLFNITGGLIAEQGRGWWDFRHKVNGVMMSPKATKAYVPKIDEITTDFLHKLHNLRSTDNKVPDNFLTLLNMWAMESVAYISMDTRMGLFEEKEDPIAIEFMAHLKVFFENIYQYDILPSIWKFYKTKGFKKYMQNLDDITNCALYYLEKGKVELQAKQRNNTITDNESGVLEKLLKIDEDVALVMTLDSIIAGVDTTSASTFHVLYSLAMNPDKQEILRNELRTILPNKDSKLTPENMNNMPYLRACIKEAFRIYPLNTGNFRSTGRDITLQGYQIPGDTDIMMAQELLLRSDKHYGQSSKFFPERFLRDSAGTKTGCPKAKDTNPFIYLPFGFGPRMCIGRRFAELEIESLVARMIRNYNLEWNGPPPTVQSNFARIPVGVTHFVLKEVQQ